MNDFDQKLKHARAKQGRVYVLVAVSLIVVGLVVTGVMAWTNGTSVTIHPSEAADNGRIDIVDGFGLTVGNAVYAIGSEPVIRASAIGYRSAERKISFQEKGAGVEITLRPLPGTVIVSTTPENADTHWVIDGQAVAIAASLKHEVEAGTYTLGIAHPYFQDVVREFSVARGEVLRLMVALKPIEGRLRIDVAPQDSMVSIAGAPELQVPVDVNKQGGAYAIKITHPDYITLSDTLEVTAAQPEVARSYRLTRKPAHLTFELSPASGHLIVDGIKVDPLQPLTVSSRVEHQVTYIKPGYYAQNQVLTLEPAEQRTARFALKPESGTLEVQAQPEASVFVDGKAVGQTPLEVQLSAVPHKVSIRKAGYRSVEKTVTPSAKSPVLVRTKLQTELAARLAVAPKQYVNAVGITLKLFQPGAFTMGAPRQELGQRANEFIRNIKLDKPFYAGLHEVTKQQYGKFKGGGLGNEPVTSVSWTDAAAYCNWLSAQEGLEQVYILRGGRLAGVNKTADGYRMLSEAEWEWLARRAGRKQQSVFPWGDNAVIPRMTGNIADENARGMVDFFVPNYNDGHAGMAPVGSFKAEASGLFDLVGNASEWVHDYYSLVPPDAGQVEVDPLGPSYGDSFVVKGSSWRSGNRTELRAAYRDGLMSGRDDLGFRVGRYLYGGVSDAPVQ